MTRKQKWWVAAAVAVVGCGGAAVTHQVMRRTASTAADRNGQPLSCIKDLALGGSHTCVLFRNGKVHCYGNHKAVGTGYVDAPADRDPVKTSVRFSAIAAGYTETCGLRRSDGTLWCWGEYPERAFKRGMFPVQYMSLGRDNVSLDLGSDRVCVVKKDTSLWCSSFLTNSAVKILNRVDAVHLGNYFGCAKTKDGDVHCWGNNDNGQLGRGSTSSGDGWEWSEPPAPIAKVGQQLDKLRVSGTSACGVTSNQHIWCWGNADDSLFADGRYSKEQTSDSEIIEPAPVKLELGIRFRDFVLGSAACVLGEDRTVWCWGGASWNEMLGEPAITFKRQNALVSLEPRPRKLAPLGNDNLRLWPGGGGHYCVQKVDQSIWCWGANRYRQVNRSLRDDVAPLSRLPIICPPP